MNTNLLPIAKDGWRYIAYSVVVFLIFWIIDLEFLEFVSFLAIIFFLFIFRNPEREQPHFQNDSVVSPVDGSVVDIQELENDDYAYKIIIESSYADVGILRAPLNATLVKISQKFGAKLASNSNLSREINENSELVFEDDKSNKVKVVHRLKQSISGIAINVSESKRVMQASRYGLMVHGTTTVYLPSNFRLNITISDELKGSETLVGYFS